MYLYQKERLSAILNSMIAPFVQILMLLLLLLFVLARSAAYAVTSARALASAYHISDIIISIIIVTGISILPETLIAVFSALTNIPQLGLGALLGSNVADLTIVLGTLAFASRLPLKVDRTFIRKDYLFLALLLLPLILGFTGFYSRLDGLILIASSVLFFFFIGRDAHRLTRPASKKAHPIFFPKEIAVFIASLLAMGVAAYFSVAYARNLAYLAGVHEALIGLLVIGLGTTLPELIFGVRATRTNHATLALGDLLGTVIADATLVLGIIALIQPFSFNPRIVVVTGIFMLLAGLFAFSLLRSGRKLTRSEGILLLTFYGTFVIIEFILRDWTPQIILNTP
ncbi:MAG: K+-dependent Na+/Ca+ exchanger related-protein [Parcubacteria group bacterium Gr01-1014_66]|nr:MAG: K+-dependent Na+/Ca+ exchanger related-protein [Parcubacteria group bacterium Gr01-1014_66]